MGIYSIASKQYRYTDIFRYKHTQTHSMSVSLSLVLCVWGDFGKLRESNREARPLLCILFSVFSFGRQKILVHEKAPISIDRLSTFCMMFMLAPLQYYRRYQLIATTTQMASRFCFHSVRRPDARFVASTGDRPTSLTSNMSCTDAMQGGKRSNMTR